MKALSVLFGLLILAAPPVAAQETRTQLEARMAESDSLAEARQFDEALQLGHRLLGDARDSLGADDTLTIRLTYRIGRYHLESRAVDSAEVYTGRALAAINRVHPSPSALRAEIANFHGVVLKSRGKVPESVTAFESALSDYESLGLDSTLAAARAMNNLASVYDNVGKLDASVAMHQRARPLLEQHLGATHPSIATSLANLGQTCYKLGQTARAEQYIREAIGILRQTLPPNSPRLAGFMGNLGYILILRSRYDEAEQILREAMSMIEQLPDGDPRAERSLYTQFSYALTRTGRHDSAAVYMQRAYDASVALGGRGSWHEANAATNLAQAKEELRLFDEADSLWSLSEQIHTASQPVDSQALLVNRYRRLHYLNVRPGSDVFAEIEQVMAMIDALYGDYHHPVAAAAKEVVAEVALNRGEITLALEAASEAFAIHWALVTEDARYLNERDALDAADDMVRARDLTLAALLAHENHAVILDSLADRLFAVKGLIAEVLAARQRESGYGDTRQADVRAAFRAARREIASRFAGSQDFGSVEYREQMRQLQHRADSLESILAARYEDDQTPLDRHLGTLRDQVAATGELLVDYLIINRPSTTTPGLQEPWLVASLWQSCGEVTCVALAPVNEVNSQLESLRRHLLTAAAQPGLPSQEDENQYRRLAGEIAALIWTPLANYWCEPPAAVAVSPDGALCMLPFAALPTAADNYLIDDYDISYVSAPRQVAPASALASDMSLLAVGDPDFDLEPGESSDLAALRSADNECRLDRLDTLGVLPLSRYESETIAARWRETTGGDATLLLGSEATEAAFRTAAPNTNVIHIATHGYYLDPRCNQTEATTRTTIAEPLPVHPLLLSGLFLSGANAVDRANDPSNDGVLSAYELVALDLQAVEVVVLSSCESGLGVSVPGEGVAGLRRALQLAGARTVICSLWPVPDRRTARFMTDLYRRPETTMRERLAGQQRRVLNDLRTTAQPTHPVSWAAFISIE